MNARIAGQRIGIKHEHKGADHVFFLQQLRRVTSVRYFANLLLQGETTELWTKLSCIDLA